jgi:hypothetical protein
MGVNKNARSGPTFSTGAQQHRAPSMKPAKPGGGRQAGGRTVGYVARIFLYGFVLFAGPALLMDLFLPPLEDGLPFWGARFLLMWGGIGGVLFLLAALCAYLLKRIFMELLGHERR